MNFLAHVYLSHHDVDLQIGNFIADHVKGKNYLNLPNGIAAGIMMHRHIDTFTDAHPIFRNSKKYFSAQYGLYAGVIVDIVYDHFLAKNWHRYETENLEEFTQHFYQNLNRNYELLPEKTKLMLPIMMSENWLYSYKTISGITKVLEKMDKRTQNLSKMRYAHHNLTQYYVELEYDFNKFFVQLDKYSRELITQIKNHENQFYRSS